MKLLTGFKILITFLIFLLSPVLEVGAQTIAPWGKLKKTYSNYFKKPSAENADKVCAVISECENAPAETPISAYVESPGAKAEGDAEDYIMANLNVLDKRIKLGDRASIHLAYRLMEIADGEFAEDLNEIIDLASLHQNPKLFLEELLDNRKGIEKNGGLSELLTFMGTQFTDQKGQPQKEYRLRIEALQKVQDPALKEIRDECIKILTDEIHKPQ